MSVRRPLSFLILVVSLGLATASVRAAPPSDAAGFINNLVNEALKALDNQQLAPQDREKRFRTLLESDFDMPRISRFVLGRYWNDASDQDKQNFQKLFQEYVIRSYSTRFSAYSGEQVKVTGSRPVDEKTTVVMSQVIRPNGAPPAKVDWRVRKEDDGFKITDVDVEGISMLITQREEFSTVIQRSGGTVSGLNNALQQKLASGDTSLAAPLLPQKQ